MKTWIAKEQQLTKTMGKDKFCKWPSGIQFRGQHKLLMDYIMSVGRYESGKCLIEDLLTSWTGWRSKTNGGVLQNKDGGCF
jgi:hypothetical protein